MTSSGVVKESAFPPRRSEVVVPDGSVHAPQSPSVNRLRFPADPEFQKDLRARVDAYFAERGISKGANAAMWAKTAFWLTLAFGSLLTAGLAPLPVPVAIALWAIAGFAFAGVGMNVSHDAIHGSTSTSKGVNALFSWTFDAVGVSSSTWRVAHNLLHHTYTNVGGVDTDIDPGPWMRFQPGLKILPWHRFQHIFAWFLYPLTSLLWVYQKDFFQMATPHPRTGARAPLSEWMKLFIGKAMHVGIFLVLPLTLGAQTTTVTIVGYVLLHAIAGFTLAVVFQLAHVVEGVRYFKPDAATGVLPRGWMEHELLTTANFGLTPLCTFITGGLDHQIEHHLFPHICHIHYRALAPIVKQCALDHGVPYIHSGSFVDALGSHMRMLGRLGKGHDIDTIAAPLARNVSMTATATG
jgi:linoleoyl-CoA desaturase